MSEHPGFFGVITSYSIHYTKLYDVHFNLPHYLTTHLLLSQYKTILTILLMYVKIYQCMTGRPGQILCRVALFMDPNNVITSYSIHYTKLYELLLGKIVGLGLVGMLQTLIYTSIGLTLLKISGRSFEAAANFV